MPGKPCLRLQCELAIGRIPGEALPEALAALLAIEEDYRVTGSITLSPRDAERFLAILDDEDAKPSEALLRAVERYKAATRE